MRARIIISKAKAALLSAALLASFAVIPVVPPAQQFVATYQALGATAEPLSMWERLTFSLLLLRGAGKAAPHAHARSAAPR
ncbi:MAG: hypothetical protein KJZ84_20415 [Bryobacteraceae bacterium]|nr:hypothetical protein [Bryobacteraceae bacterium]